MKTLRFRSTEKPIIISCPYNQSINGGWRFPVFLKFTSSGGNHTLTVTNEINNPIKLKVFRNGILFYETSYFGDPVGNEDFNDFLDSIFMPHDTIEDTYVKSTTIPASAGDVIDIKVYCPFASSSFTANLTC